MASILGVSINNGPAILWAADCGALCGSAHATLGDGAWTLTQTDDTGHITGINPDTTGDHPWVLSNSATNTAITSVRLITSGLLVFDRDLNSNGLEGTPGSSFGIDFNANNLADSGPGTPRTVTVQYDNLVSVVSGGTSCVPSGFNGGGHTPQTGCGDTWGNITFTFTGGSAFIGTVANPAIFAFYQDTDLVGAPEPVTFGLSALGLVALIAAHRFRKVRRSN